MAKTRKIQSAWRVFKVPGIQFRLLQGVAATKKTPRWCPAGWFSEDSTVILGSGKIKKIEKPHKTLASWKIAIDPYWLRHFESGFLVIACLRYFGGLHSKKYGAKAKILMNGNHVDDFGLKIKPRNHSDYFHRLRTPSIPCLRPPLAYCRTKYVWPIRKNNLTESSEQVVTVDIDKKVSWDVDYVAIVCHAVKLPQKVFLCHSSKDKSIARRLTNDLVAQGIGVWLDEAELKPGDSLIEKIKVAIDSVKYLFVLISPVSSKSRWVKKEIDIAAKTQKIKGKRVTVVPILLANCSLPRFLNGKLYADLRCADKYNEELEKLVGRVLG